MKKNYFALLVSCIFLGSCSPGEAAPAAGQISGGSSQALLFVDCKAVAEDEVEFEFSQAVTVKSLSFEPALSVASVEDGSTVRVKLEEVPGPGLLFTADILAEDSQKNTINVLAPFRSRNNRMPKLVINELCTEYASVTAGKKEEFIELKMKSGGNLGAMRVFILGNTNATKRTIYEFMPVEVEEGDYVTLHLRTYNEASKNETGGIKDESVGLNSSPLAWDFWMPGSSKLMHKAATAVYVLDQDDRVLDAVMICETAGSWWGQDYFAEAAEFLFKQGAWKSPDGKIAGPVDSVSSAGATNTRTICRNETGEDTDTAADWYITATSSATPGKPNSEKRFSN
jgi:hypothetical protein